VPRNTGDALLAVGVGRMKQRTDLSLLQQKIELSHGHNRRRSRQPQRRAERARRRANLRGFEPLTIRNDPVTSKPVKLIGF
jgi:hypothetical protein